MLPELLLLVADRLSLVDLSNFRFTCYWVCNVLTPHFQKLCLKDIGQLTTLQWAAIRGHAKLIKLAILKGAEIDVPLKGPLTLAALCVRGKLYKNIHRHPCNLAHYHSSYYYDEYATKRTPPFLAACCGHADAIEVLLDHGASMWCLGRVMTATHVAASQGNVACTEAFVRPGFDINATGFEESTILHHAITGGVEMMRYILQLKGGRNLINARTSKGLTPLHSLADINCTGQRLKMELLLQYGADMYMRDNRGHTVAHYFVLLGNSECLQFLIDAGFQLDTRGEGGSTILHTAIYSGEKIVKYILGIEGGEKLIEIKDDYLLTALDYAGEDGDLSKIKSMLEDRQAHRRTRKTKWKGLRGKITS